MKKLFLIRHGLTNMLAEGRYQGWSDPPLNEEGKREISLLIPKLEEEKIQLIITSTLIRCYDSAKILAQRLGLEIESDDRLKEMSFGDWEGLTYEEILSADPGVFECWKKNIEAFQPPGGESFIDFRDRVRAFSTDLAGRKEERIAIITHGGVIRMLLIELQGLPLEDFWKFELGTGSVTVLDWGVFCHSRPGLRAGAGMTKTRNYHV